MVTYSYYSHLSVSFGGVEEDGSIVLADFLALLDVLDRLDDYGVLHVVPVQVVEVIYIWLISLRVLSFLVLS